MSDIEQFKQVCRGNNLEYIKLETLTKTLHEVNQLDKGIAIDFDDISTKLFIQKHT